jgi:hypothetical protein
MHLLVAAETKAIGYGGISIMNKVTSGGTISREMAELEDDDLNVLPKAYFYWNR